MKILIQNMVSLRCKLFVRAELEKLAIPYYSIELGEVILKELLPLKKKKELAAALHLAGLEIMDDKNVIIVEKIKNIIITMIHHSEEYPNVNFSVFLTKKLNKDYHTLSELFSKTKGITIEHFIILHKIERVKELIMYNELNLSEISYKLHYSSVAHLSHQFKKVTGLTPSFFKGIKKKQRANLEDL